MSSLCLAAEEVDMADDDEEDETKNCWCQMLLHGRWRNVHQWLGESSGDLLG
ncbi:hypothetical protein DPMN_096465 [Dreissena polymorpha]|uniref:Uncharacterized protein n=1 Tax=Dreissena polymorpha TaxID=45954 RepID=A0A9D4L8D8_DREPO|nr:hypothetical protein DPMN_096465 [Dreissena polymorpha]